MSVEEAQAALEVLKEQRNAALDELVYLRARLAVLEAKLAEKKE